MKKKILSLVLAMIMCLTTVFSLSACGDNKKDSEDNITAPKTWQEDAMTDDMKKYAKHFRMKSDYEDFLVYYDENPDITEYDYDTFDSWRDDSGYKYDGSMDTLIAQFEKEKDDHLFAAKYLEELGKTNYYELDSTGKLLFELYAKFLFLNKSRNGLTLTSTSKNMDIKYLYNFEATKINSVEKVYMKTSGGVVGIPNMDLTKLDAEAFNFIFNEEYYLFVHYPSPSFEYYNATEDDNFLPIEQEQDVTETLKTIVNNNISFFEFLVEYRDLVYKEIRAEDSKKVLSIIPDAFQSGTAPKEPDKTPDDPTVGMTESQVLDSIWGAPDRKNIDEYEWGTHEQWVYEGKGYIYFEDGKVTSISYRE